MHELRDVRCLEAVRFPELCAVLSDLFLSFLVVSEEAGVVSHELVGDLLELGVTLVRRLRYFISDEVLDANRVFDDLWCRNFEVNLDRGEPIEPALCLQGVHRPVGNRKVVNVVRGPAWHKS